MSKVADDMNLGTDLFGETAIYFKKNWENIYVFVWGFTIAIIIINVFKLDMNTNGKKPVFKNVAIYEQFTTACKNAAKNCPKKKGKRSCTLSSTTVAFGLRVKMGIPAFRAIKEDPKKIMMRKEVNGMNIGI